VLHGILCYLFLFYATLSYPVLSCPILSYPILYYPILSYPILSYPLIRQPTPVTLQCLDQLDDSEMYASSDYGYSDGSSSNGPMKANTNVQIFARDPMLPSVTVQDTVDTDMAYTDSFRGGSLHSSQDPSSSSSSGYGSPFSTFSDSSADSVQYGHPSDSLPLQEAYYQDSTYDTEYASMGTFSSSSGDGMSRSNSGANPPSYTPDLYMNQQQQQQQYGSVPYGQPLNLHSSMSPGSYPDTGYSSYGYSDQQASGSSYSPLPLKRKLFIKGKTWMEKKNLVQSMSAFGHLPGVLNLARSDFIGNTASIRHHVASWHTIRLTTPLFILLHHIT
jgi:hypothetical protein